MLSEVRAAFEPVALIILPVCVVCCYVWLFTSSVKHVIVNFLCCIENHIRVCVNGLSFTRGYVSGEVE